MESDLREKLIRELRGRINDVLAVVQLLTPMVRERGTAQEAENLAAANQSLYQMMRTLSHVELCREDPPTFWPQATDLSRLCGEVCRQAELAAGDLGIAFRWDEGKGGVTSAADRALLELILLNLLSNAFRAAGRGGKVSLRCAVSRDRWTVTIKDSGPGLQGEEERDPLTAGAGGVGLGLEAARRAASLHGGTLILESGETGGTRAVLSLPVRRPGEHEVMSPVTGYDRTGGFSQFLVEFSGLLPIKRFQNNDLE